MYFIYKSVVLFSLTMGPLVSAALLYRSLRQHRNLARNDREYKGALILLIITNTIAALCELYGTTVIVYFVLSASLEADIRYGIFLVRI